MGMFDRIYVPCPICGELYEAQSKSGDCILGKYNLYDAPWEVLSDVNRHAPFTCGKCGTRFQVKFNYDVEVVIVD